MSPTSIAAYLVLFGAVGFLFLFVSLLIGRLLRPRTPTPMKAETYECGEPAIGSSFVQFDLRFYVVALVFIIFEVEVAFFFPWATVFGKATVLMGAEAAVVEAAPSAESSAGLDGAAAEAYRGLGVHNPQLPDPGAGLAENSRQIRQTGSRLALASMADIGVFFGVLLLGFAYVWRLGDLDWVRAVPEWSDSTAERGSQESPPELPQQ